MYQVSDVMTKDVLTVSANVTVEEAIRRLIENHISGMPVVDEDEHLIGIVTEFQLLETLYAPGMKELLVRDVMTENVLTVDSDKILSDATSLMIVHRIRRLPVVDNGKVVGIVARRDLLRYALEGGDKLDDFLKEIKERAQSHVCASECVNRSQIRAVRSCDR